MKILVVILVVAFALPAMAVDLVCTLPNAYIARGAELCEELRKDLHIRSSEWSNSECASQFLRIGLLEGDRLSAKRAARRTVNDAVNDTISDFAAAWPILIAAGCGDGILDIEFGEECDDGNRTSGDGCSSSCTTE